MGRLVKIGLAGGIGTGKSTVASMLKEMGIPVINSDEVAREVTEPGSEGYKKVVEAFGRGILNSDGTINRKKLGSIVFSDESKRRILEKILHPLILGRIRARLDELKRAGCEFVVLEVPLLFEKGLDRNMDFNVVVYTDEKTQLERLTRRDGLTLKEALSRIKSQMPLSEKVKRADFVIDNSGDLSYTKRQVEEMWKRILERFHGAGRGDTVQG